MRGFESSGHLDEGLEGRRGGWSFVPRKEEVESREERLVGHPGV